MAIYHLEAKVVSRGAGRSAVAASAYLSCSRLYNDYDGIQHDYTRKQGLIYRGATGMETSLLLKRLKARISNPANVLHILTSATLGGKEADDDIVHLFMLRILSGLKVWFRLMIGNLSMSPCLCLRSLLILKSP